MGCILVLLAGVGIVWEGAWMWGGLEMGQWRGRRVGGGEVGGWEGGKGV